MLELGPGQRVGGERADRPVARTALSFFPADDVAVATAKAALADLTANAFAETLAQPAKCDVYGVLIGGAGWYLKLTIDPQPPEGLVVISLHPLQRPIKTNTGR